MDIEKVKQQAMFEIKEEDFRKEVEKVKQKIRSKCSFWDKVFPYKVLIIKKEG